MEGLTITFGFVLARVGMFVAVLPILSGARVPRLLKAGIALVLTAFFYFSVEGSVSPDLIVRAAQMPWFQVGLVLAREAILGGLLGFAMGLVLLPAQVAGHYLGQEMGLSLGQLSGMNTADASTVVSTIFESIAGLLLLHLNGHQLFFQALHRTFTRHPIGGPLGELPFPALVNGLARSHEWGLLLAAPVGAALFITSVVLTVLNRTVPQLNLFSVGFSLRVTVGLGGVLLLFPEFVRGLVHFLNHYSVLLRAME